MSYLFPTKNLRDSFWMRIIAIWAVFTIWVMVGFSLQIGLSGVFEKTPNVWQQYLIDFSPFIPFLIALVLAPKLLGRNWRSLITNDSKINWRHYAIGFLGWLGITSIGTVFDLVFNSANYHLTFETDTFFWGLAALIVLLPIQTSAEELFFRGLIPQTVGRIVKHPFAIVAISSFLFALPHLANPEAEGIPVPALITYGAIGAAWGGAAAMLGRLEIALGAHLANNFFGLAIVGYTNSAVQGSAIWSTTATDLSIAWIPAVITTAIWLFVIYRFKERIGVQ